MGAFNMHPQEDNNFLR